MCNEFLISFSPIYHCLYQVHYNSGKNVKWDMSFMGGGWTFRPVLYIYHHNADTSPQYQTIWDIYLFILSLPKVMIQ